MLAPTHVRPGGVSISLQSGPLGTGLLEMASRLGVGLASFVSLGDKADVSGNDLLQYWEDDPATSVVLIYTESFGNPRKFARIARRLSRRKPIVAVRAGASGDPTTAALYEQAGVIRVHTVRQLFDTARVLVGPPLPRGNRVMVVSNAVSPALLALDTAQVEGLAPAELGVDLVDDLLAPLPAGSSVEGGALAADPPGHAGRLRPRRARAAGRRRRGRPRRDLRPAAAGPDRTPRGTRCWSSSRS